MRTSLSLLFLLSPLSCTFIVPSPCDEEACAPMACSAGVCLTECEIESDCADGYICDFGDCILGECLDDFDCSSDEICTDSHYCVRPCDKDRDCEDGESCTGEYCL